MNARCCPRPTGWRGVEPRTTSPCQGGVRGFELRPVAAPPDIARLPRLADSRSITSTSCELVTQAFEARVSPAPEPGCDHAVELATPCRGFCDLGVATAPPSVYARLVTMSPQITALPSRIPTATREATV